MHGYDESVEVSVDGGGSWQIPARPRGANACYLDELVVLSPTTVLLVEGGPDEAGFHPLLISQDAGITWTDVALPPISTRDGDPAMPSNLQILPNGSLLAHASTLAAWTLLPPLASSWCPIDPTLLPASAQTLQFATDRLWWLSQGDAGAMPRVGSIPLSALGCDQPESE